jgi:hypothetical protein
MTSDQGPPGNEVAAPKDRHQSSVATTRTDTTKGSSGGESS